MNFSYYPGCTLKNQGARTWIATPACPRKRWAFTLEELERVAVLRRRLSPWRKDEIATQAVRPCARSTAPRSRARTLSPSAPPATTCIKQANDAMAHDEEYLRAGQQLHAAGEALQGRDQASSTILELLRDVVGFDNLKKAVVKPLTGKKIAAYYGCLLLRPEQGHADGQPGKPHDHRGLHPRHRRRARCSTPYRNECCGGYVALEDKRHRRRRRAPRSWTTPPTRARR